MNSLKQKKYAPVTDFERTVTKAEGQRLKAEVSLFEQKTSYCPRKAAPHGGPLYLAEKQMLNAKG